MSRRRLSRSEREEAAWLYRQGQPSTAIAKRFQCGPSVVLRVLKDMGVTIRTREQNNLSVALPTPEEIQQRAAKEREHWGKRERQKRAGTNRVMRFTVPVCAVVTDGKQTN